MLRMTILSLASTIALTGAASAGDYEHEAWPVANDGNGIYSFTNSGQSQAVPLCTGFYAADLKAMAEYESATAYSQIIEEHARTMFNAYQARYTGDAAGLDQITTDMTWHFGNAAQYGSFQEFKDSANMACESYAVNNQIVSIDYINGFNDKLLSAL